MIKIFLNWALNAAAIWIVAFLLPGVSISSLTIAFILAVVLSSINLFIKPIVIILTLPINILSFGIITFVINALLIIFAAAIVPGFYVGGFWWALLFSILLSIVNTTMQRFSKESS